MPAFTTIFAPLLFGLLLLAALGQLLDFWQHERTPRVFYLLMVFACFCLLYLASAMVWSDTWRDVIRVLLIWSLTWYVYHKFKLLIDFLRKKDTKFQVDATEQPTTLEALGEAQREPGPTAALEATTIDVDPDVVPWEAETKPAIDERDFG